MSITRIPGVASPPASKSPRAAGRAIRVAATGGASLVGQDVRVAASREPYLDRGEEIVRKALMARGLDIGAFPGRDVRGLSALVGRGVVTTVDLDALTERLAKEPGALAGFLEAKRPAFMALIGRERGLSVEDGANRWTVQELANLDYVLSEMPESFMRDRVMGGKEYSNAYGVFS